MAEITWKNVNSLVDPNSYLNAIKNLQGSVTALGNVGESFLNQYHTDDVNAFKNLSQLNTNMVLNQMNQVQDMNQLQQAKGSGAYDLQQLQALTGSAIDGSAFNKAYNNWDTNTLNKVQTADTALDYSPEAQQAIQNYYQAQAIGDVNGMNQALQMAKLSNSTSQTLANNLYTVNNKEFDIANKVMNTNLNAHKIVNQADSDINSIANSPEVRDRISAMTTALNNHYATLIDESTSEDERNQLTQERDTKIASIPEQVLSENPNYQQALQQKIDAKILQEQTTNIYNQKSQALSNTASATVEEFKNQGLSPETARSLIGSESNFNPNAKNPKSTATGLSQAIKSTWNEYAKVLGLPKVTKENEGTKDDPRFNKEYSIKFAAKYAKDVIANTKTSANDAGVTSEPLIAKTGYFFGSGGANKFWNTLRKNKNTSIEAIMDKKVIDSNPQLKGKSVSQVKDWLEKIVNKDSNNASTNLVNKSRQLTAPKPIKPIQQELIVPEVKPTEVEEKAEESLKETPFNVDDFYNDNGVFNASEAINKANERRSKIAENFTKKTNEALQNVQRTGKAVKTLDSTKSAEVLKSIEQGDLATIADHIQHMPELQYKVVKDYVMGELGDINTKVGTAVKTLQDRTLKANLPVGVHGALTASDLEPVNTLTIPLKDGDNITQSVSVTADKLNSEAKENFNRFYDVYLAQGGAGWDNIFKKDDYLRAYKAGVPAATLVKLHHDALKATDSTAYEKGELPDLAYSDLPFQTTAKHGQSALNKIEALATLASNGSLDTIRNELSSLENLKSNLTDPKIQLQMLNFLTHDLKGKDFNKNDTFVKGRGFELISKKLGLSNLLKGDPIENKLNDSYSPKEVNRLAGAIALRNPSGMVSSGVPLSAVPKLKKKDLERAIEILASGAKSPEIAYLRKVLEECKNAHKR